MPKYSSKINIQLIAETLLKSGISNIVISPGSRNGGLTMQFVNDDRFNCYSVVDERSAGFVALGMAQKLNEPVVVCCTSGSAAVNYYPAITEAFYQNVPIVVLTADRPVNYVDLFDGQTIRQENVFEKHVYASIQLEEEEDDATITDNFLKIKDCMKAVWQKKGPVHINMPFSEPLYESIDEKLIDFDKLSLGKAEYPAVDWSTLLSEASDTKKILILVGGQSKDNALQFHLDKLSEYKNVIILTETTSNLNISKGISQIDSVLKNISISNYSEFKPDLLITLGQNVISKKIKNFLRENKPKYHWHVNLYWQPDTYFSLTQKIYLEANDFVSEFYKKVEFQDSNYRDLWLLTNRINSEFQNSFMESVAWSDLFVFKTTIENFPQSSNIHYSNSAVIRYSQLFEHDSSNSIFCNRGTSGIDGSTSTAIGHAIKAKERTILVTGDISFFYDSNALWNNYIPANFRIVLVNNGGGNIFKIIPGPSSTNALEKFFETKHQLTAEHLAAMFNFEYKKVANKYDLKNYWREFYANSDIPKILEIDTKMAPNAEILKVFMSM